MKQSDIEKLTNEQLISIIKKYKIWEIKSMNRETAINHVKRYMQSKLDEKNIRNKQVLTIISFFW